ncbi:MAG TPA: gephyrin-like molybdotransferase Glp [Candidatus Limnocylindria bacterium]|jgi:molybdopterin molybdotransferase|nr:gephyrin-like molybdotransferase Glp [Candidatus Limnocylindria bacterium]
MPTSPSAARAAASTLTVDEALDRVLARITPLAPTEVALLDALGAVLAEDAIADRDVPPFRNSAMDGYAVRGTDVNADGMKLRVVGAVAAGSVPDRAVGAGEAARIMTGAPIPDGADTVVRIEDTDNGAQVVTINKATPLGMAVRQAGEDLRRGEVVLGRGTLLRPADIGVLASIGRAKVNVTRRPNVAVLSTGDELVDIDEEPGPGQIRDTNRYSLAAAVRATGCSAFELGIARDSADDLRHALGNAAFGDLVVTSGGVSVGDHDHVKPVVDAMGQMDFWSIAIRPGRPLAFGELRTKRGSVPLFGLPGNPVSALLTFELFVRPALLKMAGRTKLHRPRAQARLLDRIDKPIGLRTFARGIYDAAAGTVRSTGAQGSGIMRSMSLANCLIDLPESANMAQPGESVTVLLTDVPEDH